MTTTDAFNASELVSLTRLPPWALAAVALVLGLQLWLALRATRGAPRAVRAGLFSLRAGLTVALFVLVLEPGLRLMATSRDANRVVVAVDTSGSMAEGEGGAVRARQAAHAARVLVEDLQARSAPFVPELYVFDGETRPISLAQLQSLEAGGAVAAGPASRLLSPLLAVPVGEGEKPLGGVVVISDGADTTGLTPGLTTEVRTALQRLNVPVHTVAVGAGEPFKDIALERVVADDFAFVRNKVSFDLMVRQKGFTGLEVPFTLREDGKPISTTSAVLGPSADGKGAEEGKEQTVAFTFEPQSAGKHVYTVTAPVHPDEAVAENNRLDFTLKVIRDRIRVLQVAGRPSWDERFVRRLLKENPSVDLISFFILRSTTDVAGAQNKELSLIPFPTRELFTEELHTFDVVIFQDFNYRPYQMGMYLENVKKFVEEAGGGFLMIGGELSFSEGDYDGTPIADILPVKLLPGHEHTSTERFRPVVTEAGRHHPITDLGDAVGDDDGFDKLPELEGANLVASLAPGAEALLAHPFLNVEGGPLPIVSVREVGRGRTMAVTTDSTWAWALPHVGAGGRGDAHRRFYANALRWLIKDPELSRVKVQVERAHVGPGEEVVLDVRSFNERYAPEGGADVKVTFVPLDVADQRALADPGLVKTGKTADDGTWRTTLLPKRPGAWRVKVEASHGGRSIGVDEDAFVVESAQVEKLHREPRPDLLRALSEATGGKVVDADDVAGLPFIDHEVQRVHRQKTEPLWNRWESLALIAVLAGAEWWWRRRRGFA